MAVPFNAAAAAYSNAARLISGNAPQQPAAAAGPGVDFAKMLTDSIEAVEAQGAETNRMSLDVVNGEANLVDMVTAISETEMTIQSMVTVRDRVISAYEEIMRMPI